jgi:hypothetical protein
MLSKQPKITARNEPEHLILPKKSSYTQNLAIGYETGPKAFDDVFVEYDATRAPQDHHGQPVLREHLQCKWHVKPGEFGYSDLTNPAFTNATSQSFLQRARDAQVQYAPDGTGARFKLVTNWRLLATDPLVKLIQMQWHALDLNALFDGTTNASATGKLRKAWCEHLAADEAALRRVARTLGISLRPESGDDLRERLNDRFAATGMKRVSAAEAGFFYDDVIAKLHAQGRSTFDRQSFKEMCASEKLLDDGRGKNPVTVGVRSFMHQYDNLETRCDQTLNLVPHFDGRYIRDGAAAGASFPDDVSKNSKANRIETGERSGGIGEICSVEVDEK